MADSGEEDRSEQEPQIGNRSGDDIIKERKKNFVFYPSCETYIVLPLISPSALIIFMQIKRVDTRWSSKI